MSAHDDIHFLIFDALTGQPFLFPGHGACEKFRTIGKTQRLHQRSDGLVMLPCQHLRRDHDRALAAIFRRQKESQLRQDRFSRAHVSLDQPGCDFAGSQVCLQFLPDLLLGPGQSEGKAFDDLRDLFLFFQKKRRPDLFPPLLQIPYSQDKQQKLIEDQPVSRQPHAVVVFREMDLLYGVIIFRQIVFMTNLFRQVFFFQFRLVQRLADGFLQHFCGKALG